MSCDYCRMVRLTRRRIATGNLNLTRDDFEKQVVLRSRQMFCSTFSNENVSLLNRQHCIAVCCLLNAESLFLQPLKFLRRKFVGFVSETGNRRLSVLKKLSFCSLDTVGPYLQVSNCSQQLRHSILIRVP